MKQILKYITIGFFLILLFFAFRSADTSPNISSFRTKYFGYPTNTIHESKTHLSNTTTNLFWFVHITDIHLGAYSILGDTHQYFRDFLQNMEIVSPNFIVDTGDTTNGKIPLPVAQDVTQWRDRYNILANAGMLNASYYYDLPGNHDGYNDSLTFSYFLNWSVQHKTQYVWNRTFSFGNYTFIGMNSVQNKGLSWPGGTSGDFDQAELDWLETQLNATSTNSNLTMVFAHHPENDIGHNQTSSGKSFLELLEEYKVAGYFFGHGHTNIRRNQGGTIAVETDSLGLPSNKHGYRIVTIDNDGIAVKFQELNTWPAVIITCPIDRDLTMQAPDIPNTSKIVPIRALVFDQAPVTSVEFQIDGGNWNAMNTVIGSSKLWNGSFDATILSNSIHSLTVRAMSASGTQSDTIYFRVGTSDRPEIINGHLPSFRRVQNSLPWQLNLSMYEWDRIDNGINLTWTVSNNNPTICQVLITDPINNLVTFIPLQNAVGTAVIRFTLQNSRGQEVSQTISITLVPRLNNTVFQLTLSYILIAAVSLIILINILWEKWGLSPSLKKITTFLKLKRS
ncbi:MAG: metallophosphoesterase [Candidatus Helarchaeota archaeon]